MSAIETLKSNPLCAYPEVWPMKNSEVTGANLRERNSCPYGGHAWSSIVLLASAMLAIKNTSL